MNEKFQWPPKVNTTEFSELGTCNTPTNSTMQQVWAPWGTDNQWREASTLVIPLCRQQGHSWDPRPPAWAKHWGLALLFSAILSIKKPPTFKHHCLHSHFSRKMLAIILPYQYQLCICVCFCAACALEMCFGFSSNPLRCPQRDLHCYKGLLRLFPVYTQLFPNPGTCAFGCLSGESGKD